MYYTELFFEYILCKIENIEERTLDILDKYLKE